MAASDADAVTGPDRDDTQGQETATDDAAGSGAGLSDAARAWVRRIVAEMGPLTEDERDYLAYMFHRRG